MPANIQALLIEYHLMTKPEDLEKNEPLAILALAHHIETSLVADNLRLHDSLPGDKKRLMAMLAISDEDYSDFIQNSRNIISEHIALVA